MPYCDEIDAAARAIGSVNTLVRRPDGKLYAYNTDAAGFCYMARRAGISFAGRKAVMLGQRRRLPDGSWPAPGSWAPRQVVVISRSGPDNYETLSRHADADDRGEHHAGGDVPRQRRRAGGSQSLSPPAGGVLDVMYNPRRTALLQQAEDLGIPCSDGLPMLVAQAKRSGGAFLRDMPLPTAKMNVSWPSCGRRRKTSFSSACPAAARPRWGRLLAQS